MRLREAVEMLAPSGLASRGPMTWADLGCGDGTFTRALAELLAPGSLIHAMDLDRAALRLVPSASTHRDVQIATHHGDFTQLPWPFSDLDGVLMANSLHYVRDQVAFIAECRTRMKAPHRFLIVEYDSDTSNSWVPYPLSRQRLATLFDATIDILHTRPSCYQRAALYAALIAFA
jgi:ubiquinone/menaquinone biosynthesis C-methylase UbiE